MRPRAPHQGAPPWTRCTMGLGLKKSSSFCAHERNDVGLCAPRPHQGVPPWTRYTMGLGLRKSSSFCAHERNDVGRCPTPRQVRCPWIPVHNFTGFKKSVGFCVEQQERMCCSIPRQRLSVRSGPGQPVDRGFSDDRHRESLLSRMRFIPKTAPCRGEHGRNPA